MEQLEQIGSSIPKVLRYVVVVTAMTSANKPHLIPQIVAHCEETLDEPDILLFLTQARESLVKMISTIGAPRVINGTAALVDSISRSEIREKLSQQPQLRQSTDSQEKLLQRGLSLWNKVYARQADKLETKIGQWNPDLVHVIQSDLYGHLLSEERILDARSTELCTIAALVPIQVPSQLKSHLLGAARLGAQPQEIDAAKDLAEYILTFK